MSAKRYASVKEKTGEGFFGTDEAIKKLAASASAKFDETADMACAFRGLTRNTPTRW